MTDQEIKIGAVVALKSGGPVMTATHEISVESSSKLLVCQWFHLGEIREMKCKPEALLLTKPKPVGSTKPATLGY